MLPRGTASNGMSTNIGGKRAGENVGGVSRAPLAETGDDGADESDMETSDGMESVRSRCRASALGLRLVRPRLPTEFILKTCRGLSTRTAPRGAIDTCSGCSLYGCTPRSPGMYPRSPASTSLA